VDVSFVDNAGTPRFVIVWGVIKAGREWKLDDQVSAQKESGPVQEATTSSPPPRRSPYRSILRQASLAVRGRERSPVLTAVLGLGAVLAVVLAVGAIFALNLLGSETANKVGQNPIQLPPRYRARKTHRAPPSKTKVQGPWAWATPWKSSASEPP
jgi:hypothetical protein